MALLKPYQYTALPNSNTHIRLLVFAINTDELNCSLKIYPISKVPFYEAVSYTWGTQTPTSFLPCDGASLIITPHLLEGIRNIWARAKALLPTPRKRARDLRRKRERIWRLWIDAICINQKDDIEKAGQVPLMAKIYSDAHRVLVWLGPAADGSDVFLDQMELMTSKLQDWGKALGADKFTVAGLPPHSDPTWSSLAELWSRPWFRRLWIIQEIVLAKAVVFVCGTKTMGLIKSKARIESHALAGCTSILELDNLRKNKSRGRINFPLNLLERGRLSEVGEPVDRILGLLGLFDSQTQDAVAIDYSPKAREQYWNLYILLTKTLIKRFGLTLLAYAESETRPPMLPSWVPNWNSTQPIKRFSGHFHAGFLHSAFPPSRDICLPDSNSIQVGGFKIGTVLATSILRYYDMNSGMDDEVLKVKAIENLKAIMDAHCICQSLLNSQDHQKFPVAFARTLVADSYVDHGISTSQNYHQDVLEDFNWYMHCLECWSYDSSNPQMNEPNSAPAHEHSHPAESSAIDYWPRTNPSQPPDPAPIAKVRKHVDSYVNYLPIAWASRCFLVTNNGKIGLASQSCRPGDKICIFPPAKTPIVLRPVENQDSFTLVCEAYVDGVMYGEALEHHEDKHRMFVID